MQFETKHEAKELLFTATGTQWRILFKDDADLEACKKIIAQTVESFEAVYSRFRMDSSISKLELASTTQPLIASDLLDFYADLDDATDGLVVPSVGGQLVDAGYDREYSLKPSDELRNVEDWRTNITWTHSSITSKKPLQLDFGAAGKGCLIDLIAHELSGYQWLRINGGGDILVSEQRKIGMENPFKAGSLIGEVDVESGALCSSSPNRRDWGEYHHIIDPKKKTSPRDTIAATWVMAETAMLADGIATALFLVQPEELLKRFSFDYAILTTDMKLTMTSVFAERSRMQK